MENFRISRIHCAKGIFQMRGQFEQQAGAANIQIDYLAKMSTDGWEALNLDHPDTQQLLADLRPDITQHLATKS